VKEKNVSKKLVVFAGLLASPVATQVHQLAPAKSQADPRLVLLHEFFRANKCPVNQFTADFIRAADTYSLDWRLLPSISFVESGGGKDYRNNNVFGWDSCRERFPSVRAGIHFVASRLASSRLYKDKDLDQILKTYNPSEAYSLRVKSVMNSIGSSDLHDATVN
jgi:hypothetical protein